MNVALDNTPLVHRFAELIARTRALRRAAVGTTAHAERQHRLVKGGLLIVQRPLGQEVVCLEGTLWITHTGDIKDLVLERGEHYLPERSARMTIQALDDAVLQLV